MDILIDIVLFYLFSVLLCYVTIVALCATFPNYMDFNCTDVDNAEFIVKMSFVPVLNVFIATYMLFYMLTGTIMLISDCTIHSFNLIVETLAKPLYKKQK